jgi:hypothetical protein
LSSKMTKTCCSGTATGDSPLESEEAEASMVVHGCSRSKVVIVRELCDLALYTTLAVQSAVCCTPSITYHNNS